ncbi:MAG: HAD-superfamily hydrolase, subfamily, partial [Rhizorhabdus sp.]|nr:HAD-superfamily hydrolase, subfamily [Rhizorhabdus sp.]
LAIVSGRSICQLDAMLGAVAADITLAGSHGAELRHNGQIVGLPRPAGLDAAGDEIRLYVDAHPGTIAELKSFGVALHYRLAPLLEADAQTTAIAIAARHGLAVQPGKMMIELHTPGTDKGDAVDALLAMPPMEGSIPIMIGDDLTDEPALAAAALHGGFGILVGPERDTAALYGLADVADVRHWLGLLVEAGA